MYERAICHAPILGVMRLLQRITNASVAPCKDPVAGSIHSRRIELNIHQFVHVPENKHIAVQLYDSVILREGKRRHLAPAIVEAGIFAKVLCGGWKQVLDMLLGYASSIECGVSFGRESICIQRYKGICRFGLLEAVVESEEAREVVRVGDKGRPDCSACISDLCRSEMGHDAPLFESTTRSLAIARCGCQKQSVMEETRPIGLCPQNAISIISIISIIPTRPPQQCDNVIYSCSRCLRPMPKSLRMAIRRINTEASLRESSREWPSLLVCSIVMYSHLLYVSNY
jgi:hypothetical protein